LKKTKARLDACHAAFSIDCLMQMTAVLAVLMARWCGANRNA